MLVFFFSFFSPVERGVFLSPGSLNDIQAEFVFFKGF